LADQTDRRTRLVEQLFAGPAYARHASQTSRAFLVPQASANPRLQHLVVSLEACLRQRIRAGRSYDAIVREILTATLDYHERSADRPGPSITASPLAFYQANDLKAETIDTTLVLWMGDGG
jgi:hypothetical protein